MPSVFDKPNPKQQCAIAVVRRGAVLIASGGKSVSTRPGVEGVRQLAVPTDPVGA